jgi:hypothetical protein
LTGAEPLGNQALWLKNVEIEDQLYPCSNSYSLQWWIWEAQSECSPEVFEIDHEIVKPVPHCDFIFILLALFAPYILYIL